MAHIHQVQINEAYVCVVVGLCFIFTVKTQHMMWKNNVPKFITSTKFQHHFIFLCFELIYQKLVSQASNLLDVTSLVVSPFLQPGR